MEKIYEQIPAKLPDPPLLRPKLLIPFFLGSIPYSTVFQLQQVVVVMCHYFLLTSFATSQLLVTTIEALTPWNVSASDFARALLQSSTL